jgi:hypothetical protein
MHLKESLLLGIERAHLNEIPNQEQTPMDLEDPSGFFILFEYFVPRHFLFFGT